MTEPKKAPTLNQALDRMNIDPNNEWQMACAMTVARISQLVVYRDDPGLKVAYEVFYKAQTVENLRELNAVIDILWRREFPG